jgi:HEAT repeat protein
MALAMATSSGYIEPARSLRNIPEALVVELVDETEANRPLQKHLLPLLAQDPRASVRERVASAASTLAPHSIEAAEALVEKLANDSSPSVRTAASRSLASILESAHPLLRIEIVSRWSLSPQVSQRRVIARALRGKTSVFVSDLALEELSTDEDSEVRALAARAMTERLDEAPQAYERALARLAADPHPRVARTVSRLQAIAAARHERA